MNFMESRSIRSWECRLYKDLSIRLGCSLVPLKLASMLAVNRLYEYGNEWVIINSGWCVDGNIAAAF